MRTTLSGIRYAKACVNNMNGVILLPDDWNSSQYTLFSTDTFNADFVTNTISEAVWNRDLAPYGCVFLPCSGHRAYTSVYNIGTYGGYWSSSYYDNTHAYDVNFDSSNLRPQGFHERCVGYAVRLVRNAE